MYPKAIIFDLDGVLTDTARFHYLAWKQLADKLGLPFTEKDNERLKGVDRIRSFEIILEINHVLDQFSIDDKNKYANEKNEIYKQLIENITPADILEGIPELIDSAKDVGIKLAVASSSKNATRVLQLLNITEQFDYVAESAQIRHPKPAPDIFLDCAKGVGVNPELCVGVEDAQAGIEAIHSAGMFAVGIHVDVTSIMPDLIIQSTSELSLEVINRFYKKWYQ